MASSYDEVLVNKNFLPLNFDQLTPRMLQIAKEELNENKNTRSSSIELLRKLIIEKCKFKCRNDEEFLLQFLRARKFDAQKALDRFQTFFQVTRKTFSHVLADIDDEKLKNVLGVGFASLLPYRDLDGAAIGLVKMSNWKVEDTDVCSIINCLTIMSLTASNFPATQVCGFQIIVDVKGTTMQHVRSLKPRFLYLLSKGLQDCMPVRFKGIHFINTSKVFPYIWSIVNTFLSKKLRKRVHFHDAKLENFQKFFPKEILPTEYGGEYSDFDPVKKDAEEMVKFLSKYVEILRGGYTKDRPISQ